MRELVATGQTGQTKTANMSYKVKISTADVENAGTRDHIRMRLFGEDGEADIKLRNSIGLKKADNREFDEVSAKNVGIMKSVSISLENVKLRDKCYMSIVEIIADGNTYNVPVDQWVSIDPIKIDVNIESGLGTFIENFIG